MPAAPTLDLTRDLRELTGLAASESAAADLLRRGLDWLERVAPYDLATVMELQGGELVVRAARGKLADSRVRRHRLPLAEFPTVASALESRRARAFHEHDHARGDGDPFDGVLDLPHGHACMVVPLASGGRARGILTLDREVCSPYPQEAVDLVEVYAQLLALALELAESRAQIARARGLEAERAELAERELASGADAGLESSRAPAVRALARRARQVAATDTPVLIRGPTGTGKERLARALHAWSPRSARAFVKLNCAAIPAGLLESELFGHVKGAFTGAARERAGRFAAANGGTLFLDEIGELPVDVQAKLLRVLQEGTFEPVGSDDTVKVDVRILAATHADLERRVAEGSFRADLFYRLDVFPLVLPPLAERLEDLPELTRVLLDELAARTGRRGRRLNESGLAHLARHAWPGNIRELANVLERALILSTEPVIGPELLELPGGVHAPPPAAAPASAAGGVESAAEHERRHIERVLGLAGGRIYGPAGAASLLGLKPSTLQSRMLRLGIARRGAARRSE
jgi:transcriptional regulator with GAF, ATPase, and Fis domain